jgi:hypothetical protein
MVNIVGAPTSSILEGTQITLTGNVSGGISPFTYAWTVTVTPNGAVPTAFASGANPGIAFLPNVAGTYMVSLSVTSSGGGTTTVTANISVTVPPPLTNGNACNGIYSGTFTGNVNISAGENCFFINATIIGNVQATGGSFRAINTMIRGNVQMNGGNFSIGPSVTISGNLQAQNLPAGSVNLLCGSVVYGGLQYQNSAAALQVGSASSSTCAGNVIGGDVSVQNNSGSTSLYSNAITGNLTDQSNTGASQVFSNTVGGNLQCQSNSSITGGQNTAQQIQGQCAPFPPATTGGPQLMGSTACNGVYTGTFNGNITVTAGQSCTLQNAYIVGNVLETGGNLILSGGFVRGSVQINNGGTFSVGPSTTVSGNIQVQHLPAGTSVNQICGATVNGDVQIQNNAAPVQVGSQSGCGGNSIGGSVSIQSNSASTSIDNNLVIGNLTDQSNTGASQVFSNTVGQSLACQGNASITGGQNTAQQKQNQCALF